MKSDQISNPYKTYWYKRIAIMLLVFVLSVGGGYYIILKNQMELNREVNADTSGELLIPGGMPVGIYLETNGALVLGTDKIKGVDGQEHEPAAKLVKEGDYIIGVGDKKIENKSQLVKAVASLTDEDVVLKVRRKQEEIDIRMKAVDCGREEYKLGIWVRDNAQGLGTVTFLNADSQFGALGHGIRDMDTDDLLKIEDGLLYTTSIKDIQKGQDGLPGGMEGIIVYNNYNILGSIDKNTKDGIFGSVDRVEALFTNTTPVEAAGTEADISEGDAYIRCAVSGEVEDYKIRITKVDSRVREANKKIVLEVTDERLLALTGGIVQGMSGSPILQDGKLVGAVTHVFVRDPKKGYGIFIQDMLNHIE